jgi:hypothetical protein
VPLRNLGKSLSGENIQEEEFLGFRREIEPVKTAQNEGGE